MERNYRSIFSPSTPQEREKNFETYWTYTQEHDGEILEDQKDLVKKKALIEEFRNNSVRSRRPLADPAAFYRNYIDMKDDPKTLDRKTLLLTCIYKFARHEWVGISGAWDAIPSMAESKTTIDKISRYHLCEEFCHVRLFHEMFRTMRLEDVKWVTPGKAMQAMYRIFPKLPEALMSAPAFVTELMGITFYQHVDALLDEVFADEPEARDRIRALLHEIMVDELAHIGQRRNFIGSFGIRVARWMVAPLYRVFFADIPEAKLLFDVDKMIEDGLAFQYEVSPELLKRSWVPSYCVA
ncbi:MAG TPA: hypothetical protein VFX30_06940 [bacterium]|nr:hypothetical protein [bacterium]